jgi:hypothetical protein
VAAEPWRGSGRLAGVISHSTPSGAFTVELFAVAP